MEVSILHSGRMSGRCLDQSLEMDVPRTELAVEA
jgi:hypothetical protein